MSAPRYTNPPRNAAGARRAVPAIACLLLLALACASSRVRSNVAYRQTRSSYAAVLKNWTRSAQRFDGLETDALMTATFWSEPMSRAYAGEKARAEAYPPDEAQRLLEFKLDDHARLNRFRVTFFTVERAWNDLEKIPSSWRLYLIASTGEKVEPISIHREKIQPPSEAVYFPQINAWARTYEVDFPKADAAGKPLISETDGTFGLLITGARARAELVWRVSP